MTTQELKPIYCGLFTDTRATLALKELAETCGVYDSYDKIHLHHITTAFVARQDEDELKSNKSYQWTLNNLGRSIFVKVLGFYGDPNGACFVIDECGEDIDLSKLLMVQRFPIPHSSKSKLHITIGTNGETKPFYSNKLINEGRFHRIDSMEVLLKVGFFANDQEIHFQLPEGEK